MPVTSYTDTIRLPHWQGALSSVERSTRTATLRFLGASDTLDIHQPLSFTGEDLRDARYDALFNQRDLIQARLINCDVSGRALGGKLCRQASFDGTRAVSTVFTFSVLNEATFNHSGRRQANLTGAYMDSARLHGTEFIGAILDEAILSAVQGTKTNFSKASMRNTRIVDGSELLNACFDDADLSGADLRGSVFNDPDLSIGRLTRLNTIKEQAASFRRAKLHGTDFTGSHLIGADFSSADFSPAPHAPEAAMLYNTKLEYANFTGADLTGVKFEKVWLSHANFTRAILAGADFSTLPAANMLKNANFTEADLSGSVWDGMKLAGVNFRKAILKGARLNEANLSRLRLDEANLEGAELNKAVLRRARLTGAHLEGANLQGADLRGADLSKATFDEATQWTGARYNRQTTLPPLPDAVLATMIYEPDLLDHLPGARSRKPSS